MRIFQQGLFLLSSALYRLGPQSSAATPGPVADEWADLSAPTTFAPLRTSRGVITYHPWYQGFHARQVNMCLAEAAALSAGSVRGDLRWSDVLPDGIHPDERAIAWYRSYLQAHRWYGLRPMIVLSQPPAAALRLGQQSDAFMQRWLAYVHLVVQRFGDLCDAYQVMNEPNNPVYSFFPTERQGAAITSAAQVIHAQVPHALIVVNVLMDLMNWRDTITQLLRAAGPAIDVIGVDHYPGTWTFSDEADWSGFTALAQEVANATDTSMWRHTKLALIETGFATNSAWLRNEVSQSAYFDEVVRIVHQVDAFRPGGLLSHVGVYELVDMKSDAILDPESHFGVLTSQLTRKTSFESVARLFAYDASLTSLT